MSAVSNGAAQEGSSHAAEGGFPPHGALLVPLIQQGSSLELDWHSLKLAGNFNPLLDLLDEDLEVMLLQISSDCWYADEGECCTF